MLVGVTEVSSATVLVFGGQQLECTFVDDDDDDDDDDTNAEQGQTEELMSMSLDGFVDVTASSETTEAILGLREKWRLVLQGFVRDPSAVNPALLSSSDALCKVVGLFSSE